MAFNPPKWGGETTSKDYEMLIAGNTPVDEPISLIGHSLTGITPETRDAVTMPVVEKVRGRIVNRVKTLRPAENTGLTGTIGFGNALWTPAMQRARVQGGCETTLYIDRLCPADPDERITYIFPETTLAQPTRVNDPVTVDEDNLIEWQSELRAPFEIILWAAGGFELTDLSDPMYAVAFSTEECAGCSETTLYQNIVAVGGTSSVRVVKTTDRFSDYDVLDTSNAPASRVGTSVWTEGDIILVGFANDDDFTAAATGGTLFSADGGETAMAVDSNITTPVNGVTRFAGQYVAVGGVGGGQAQVWTSTNGIDWTPVSSPNLPADAAISAIAVDNDEGVFYVSLEGGNFLKGRLSGTSISLTPIALPNVTTTDLYSVAVLGEGHIAVGGETGYYAESFDSGDEWVQPSFPGTNTAYAIGGSVDRVLTASGSTFYMRDLQTRNVFTSATANLRDGASVSGVVRGIYSDTTDRYERHNYIAAVTDSGQVFLFRPLFPNA